MCSETERQRQEIEDEGEGEVTGKVAGVFVLERDKGLPLDREETDALGK